MSSERSGLPVFESDELLRCLQKLISVDQEWVPYSPSGSLYVRPTIISTEPTVGVTAAKHALLYIILSPVGPYFKSGLFSPISLFADDVNVRAWRGGVGQYKMGCNYAPGIVPQIEANKRGCQSIMWLYGEDHEITEAGTMNIFLYWKNKDGEMELITPPLDSPILPGVTRSSVLELAREWGEFKVAERAFNMEELLKGIQENRVKEMFGTGTAAVVCPIGSILFKGETYQVPTMDDGAPLSTRFVSTITDIQYGRIPSTWTCDINDGLDESDMELRSKAR